MDPHHHIKGYKVSDRIGVGGFGAVYRAVQSTVGREVAIKVILPGMANQPDFIRRFEGEAQTIARLEHPHITPLYDYWRDPDGAYLVMRWLRGGSVADSLKNGPFELRAAALLLDQIAGALSLAHRNGVIHRDLKPGNILLDEDGNAYLTDFGIAKDLNIPDGATQQDAIVGSLDYISPEQARSEPVTPRTDIYSLGVTLYEIITGHHPFENMSSIERLYKHINDPLPNITTLDPSVQSDVNHVIQKATEKDPDHRYPDALTFAAEFREAVGLNRSSTTIVELLTQREHEILQLIIDGCSNKEIAQKLTVTLSTVKWYVNQIYSKMGVRSRVQAIVRARELHLITKSSEGVPSVHIPTEDFNPENPYKGLRAFQSADTQDFFGREKITAKLINRMGEKGDYARFLAVVGPSGSGKSSLVKAGLIPALWRGDLPGSEKWFIVEMLPGARPLDELEITLTKIAANQSSNLRDHLTRDKFGLSRAAGLILPNDGSDLVLVIDQFEEVFTLLEDEAARVHFLDLIYSAVTESRSRVRVVITLRADFYDRPLHYVHFGEMVRSRLETVLPLSAEELERAITKPAEAVGAVFEAGLVASIITDVKYQPGALPLLQYALTELFERRQGRLLTHEAYQAIGGTVGALAKRADELYCELSEVGQALAQQVFLRLVTLGEGTEDTRRRVERAELLAMSDNPEQVEEIVDLYAEYRLLSLDNDPATRTPTIELAHEAIIREWERLREWLNSSRDDIKLQRQLSAMAAEWQNARRDPSFLTRGVRLEQFERWAVESTISRTPLERVYLDASLAERQHETIAAQQQRERETRLERRSQNFLRGLVAVFAVATLVAVGLSLFAFSERSRAETALENEQEARAESESNFTRAERQRLALLADEAMDKGASGNVGFALAVRSLQHGYNPEADIAIQRATRQGIILKELVGFSFEVNWASYSADGSLLVASGEGGAQIYDAATGEPLRWLIREGYVMVADFLPVDHLILTWNIQTDSRDSLLLWDADTGELLRTFQMGQEELRSFDYTSDGRHLAVVIGDSVIVWDVMSGMEVARHSASLDGEGIVYEAYYDHEDKLLMLIHTADNRRILRNLDGTKQCSLADGGPELKFANMRGEYLLEIKADYTIQAWNYTTCKPLAQFAGHTDFIYEARISARGDYVISGDALGNIIQWDLQTGREIARFYSNTIVLALAISPDEQYLVTGTGSTAYLWWLKTSPEPHEIVTTISEIAGPRFSPDGKEIYTSAFGAMEWRGFADITGAPKRVFDDFPTRALDISPDGRYLVIGQNSSENTSHFLLDARTFEIVREYKGHTDLTNWLNFSPDGKLIGSGSFDNTVIVWDVETGQIVQTYTEHQGATSSVNFTADGRTAVSGSTDGTARIWNVVTGETYHVLDHNGSLVDYAEFSPDGTLVATADLAGFAVIWDAETGQEIHRLPHTDAVWSLSFSNDGQYLVTSSFDGRARIWNPYTGELQRVLETNSERDVFWADFSPDGKYIGAGVATANLYLWRTDLNDIIADFCARNPLDLTDAQRTQYEILDTVPTCSLVEQ